MSCDAKIWQEDNGDWCAVHDGPCRVPERHKGDVYDLEDVLASLNQCLRPTRIRRWELHVYPDGKAGLRGWSY